MVFIYNFNFRETQLVKKCLETLYGVGNHDSSRLLAKFFIHPTARVGSLSNAKVTALSAELSTMRLENELRRKVQDDIIRLKDMGSYRGRRHAMSLPVRGQRTRSQIITARKLNRTERRL